MATPFLSFTLTFFFLVSTPFASAGPTSATFIRAKCSASNRYPALCYHTLSPYARRIGNSNRQLAAVALAVSHARVKLAALSLSRLRRSGNGSRRDQEALGECVAVVGEGARQLARSVVELGRPGEGFGWRVSNVETWVSTALTDIQTCLEGFTGRSKVQVAVRRSLADATRLTSVALALVNRFAAAHG